MADIIELARQIGREIQKDERYQNLRAAEKKSDEDEELQRLIGEFNLKRIAINNEAQKETRDDEKLQQFNREMRECYASIMENSHMIAYDVAKQEMDALLQRVHAIITQSAQGEDPDTTDYVASCGGDCGSCGGCH